MQQIKHIIYLGCEGFPIGLAEVQKTKLISKALINAGNRVTVVCQNGIHEPSKKDQIQQRGCIDNINYIYTSGSPFRAKKFFKRNLLKLKGMVKLILYLIKIKQKGQLDVAILSTHSFNKIIFYTVLANILRFKTILNYVEFYSGVQKKWYQVFKLVNDNLFDKYAPRFTNASFPISEFLINHVQKTAPNKKYLKVPVLTDFNRYKGINQKIQEPYFLFCGSTAYIEVILFIMKSFEILNRPDVYLYLVINGNQEKLQELRAYIKKNQKSDQIKLFSKLSDQELSTYYLNALSLLIPLRPVFQDIARFPHKTGEYLASGRTVISTNYGEMKFYFNDEVNMILANEYDTLLFSAKMRFVLDNIGISANIGKKGREFALENFEYLSQGPKIDNFIDSIMN